MEDATQFDLNAALNRWRQNLSEAPALRSGDLDELDSHLRDSVASLQASGLSAREAFWVATSRLGTIDVLDAEFGKVNAEHVWLDRALWMVVGSVGILAVSSLVSVAASLATIGFYAVGGQGMGVASFGFVVYLTLLSALLLIVWRSGRRQKGFVWRVAAWTKSHPVAGAMCVALFFALNTISSTVTAGISQAFMPVATYGLVLKWRWVSILFPVIFWPVVLGWLLKRTAQKPIL